MARKRATHVTQPMVQQLSLDDLLAQFDAEPEVAVRVPVSNDDIGGMLLDTVSNGLYTNKLHCIREYVQNAVDAQAKNVIIKMTANSVIIHDDGIGMNLEGLLEARKFSLSGKSLKDNVGFRGIGIYSGYSLSNRLRISTTKEGDPYVYVLTFDFEAMKQDLDAEQGQVPLLSLIYEHTYVKRESSDFPLDSHFTHVELQDISDTHIKALSNRSSLRHYLLQNLPVDFAEQFDYRAEINQNLHAHVRGYNSVKITLQSDGQKDEEITKDDIPNLQHPTYGYITTSNGKPIAYYWACLNNARRQVDRNMQAGRNGMESQNGLDRDRKPLERGESSNERLSYEGFVYKCKGFTIGDRHKLQPMFSHKPQLYPWYTGEIYVIDPDVIPNAERDDFETNAAKAALEMAVKEKLRELEHDAEIFQARGVADERIEKYETDLTAIESQVNSDTVSDAFDAHDRLGRIMDDLKRQKNYASQDKRAQAEDIIKRSDRLRKHLRKEVESPTPEATRRKRVARKEPVPNQAPLPIVSPLPSVPVKTLPDVLQEIGWDVEDRYAILVQTIQESLADILSVGSVAYQSLLRDIEARLVAANGDE